ncbi:MAG TPA: hypothetical protein ACFCUY_01575 [Xenococcaceae cyanobacterium]
MPETPSNSKDDFLNPIGKYYGEFAPGKLVFNANLQEFANRVSYICGLETNGKLTSHEAYERIKNLWQELQNSKQELLDETDTQPPNEQ